MELVYEIRRKCRHSALYNAYNEYIFNHQSSSTKCIKEKLSHIQEFGIRE